MVELVGAGEESVGSAVESVGATVESVGATVESVGATVEIVIVNKHGKKSSYKTCYAYSMKFVRVICKL